VIRALVAWVISPEVRRLRAGLEAERRLRADVDAQLGECRRLTAKIATMVTEAGLDRDVAWWRSECASLRRLCSAQADQLARLEGRPVQADLPAGWCAEAKPTPTRLVDAQVRYSRPAPKVTL
jgi:hypothetical protein